MSDSDTTDSDCGVRYKTTTTRHKHSSAPSTSKPDRASYRESQSTSRHSDRRRYRRSRSKSPDRRRYRRRSRSAESSAHSRTHNRSSRSSRNVSPERTATAPSEKLLDISVSSVSSQDDHLEQHQREEKQSNECFGPSLPPALAASKDPSVERDGDECCEVIGPALPPHLLDRKPEPLPEPRSIGPSLPPGFNPAHAANDHATSESELSPFSEPDDEDPDEGDIIGPLPGSSGSRANVELEQRALEMKIRQMEEATALANGTSLCNVPKAREDWMLELPDIRKIPDMGLGARQFRTREKPEIGDRSVWTDTPADRERKKSTGAGRSSKGSDPAEDRERERERKLIEKRDKEQEKMAKQHKKKQKRDKTLLEIHQDKLKKEKKDSSDGTRRPFSRDLDLQANRFDEAQKKAVMKKAQLLDTRFSSGSSKYL